MIMYYDGHKVAGVRRDCAIFKTCVSQDTRIHGVGTKTVCCQGDKCNNAFATGVLKCMYNSWYWKAL